MNINCIPSPRLSLGVHQLGFWLAEAARQLIEATDILFTASIEHSDLAPKCDENISLNAINAGGCELPRLRSVIIRCANLIVAAQCPTMDPGSIHFDAESSRVEQFEHVPVLETEGKIQDLLARLIEKSADESYAPETARLLDELDLLLAMNSYRCSIRLAQVILAHDISKQK